MSVAVSTESVARRLSSVAQRHAHRLGVLMVAWASSWNSLACDPHIDMHMYPFF